MFINKLKTKLRSFFFLQNGFKDTKNLPLLFEEISRQELSKCLRKFVFVVKKTLFAVRSLRAKIIIVGNSKFGEGKRRNEFVEWHVAWLAE